MANIRISLAIAEYDHVRDLLDGTVRAEGIDINPLRLSVEEIFHRFMRFREWDVSEMSFGKVISLASQSDRSLVAIPVFPRRVFRHSSIYVRSDGNITKPGQLAGKKIGIPEWAQTAAVYSRGMLVHEHGVDLKSIHWFQAGVNDAGRAEKVKLDLPAGLRYTAVPDRTLSEMLLAGDLDALLTARPPAPFVRRDPKVRRLFEDFRAAEHAYWEKTGIFPIMHVMVMRRELYDRNPWVAMNLVKAFEEAKNRSLERVAADLESFLPLPWAPSEAGLARKMLGEDYWPYGIEPNRATLEAFAQYAFEQGVCHRKVTLEELFPPEVQTRFRV